MPAGVALTVVQLRALGAWATSLGAAVAGVVVWTEDGRPVAELLGHDGQTLMGPSPLGPRGERAPD